MIAQFEQDLHNKNFTRQGQGKDDDTLVNRIILWLNIICNAQGPEPDKLYEYDYNDEGLDGSVLGSERRKYPERRELKKLLDILRSE